MELSGIIISIIALLFSIYTYLIHDRKIRKQDKLLNKYEIERFEREKESEKRAVIEANLIKSKKSNVIKIYNKGKSIAVNVKIILPDDESVFFHKNLYLFPEIRPQNSVEIPVFLSEGGSDFIKLEYEWQDDFKDKNTDTQSIQI